MIPSQPPIMCDIRRCRIVIHVFVVVLVTVSLLSTSCSVFGFVTAAEAVPSPVTPPPSCPSNWTFVPLTLVLSPLQRACYAYLPQGLMRTPDTIGLALGTPLPARYYRLADQSTRQASGWLASAGTSSFGLRLNFSQSLTPTTPVVSFQLVDVIIEASGVVRVGGTYFVSAGVWSLTSAQVTLSGVALPHILVVIEGSPSAVQVFSSSDAPLSAPAYFQAVVDRSDGSLRCHGDEVALSSEATLPDMQLAAIALSGEAVPVPVNATVGVTCATARGPITCAYRASVRSGRVLVAGVRFFVPAAVVSLSVTLLPPALVTSVPFQPFVLTLNIVTNRLSRLRFLPPTPPALACAVCSGAVRVAEGGFVAGGAPVIVALLDSRGNRSQWESDDVATAAFVAVDADVPWGWSASGAAVSPAAQAPANVARLVDGAAQFGPLRVPANTSGLSFRLQFRVGTVQLFSAPLLVTSSTAPSVLAFAAHNAQLDSPSAPMVATHARPMPAVTILQLRADGAFDATATGVAVRAACVSLDGLTTLSPTTDATATLRNGLALFPAITFRLPAGTTDALCRLVFTADGSGAWTSSAVGQVHGTLRRAAAVSFARQQIYSGLTRPHLSSTLLQGLPLPSTVVMLRTSDWSVDRASSEDTLVAATDTSPVASGVVYTFGGEGHFSSITPVQCEGGCRMAFGTDSAVAEGTAAPNMVLRTGVLTNLARSTNDTADRLALAITAGAGEEAMLGETSVFPVVMSGATLAVQIQALRADFTRAALAVGATIQVATTPPTAVTAASTVTQCVLDDFGACAFSTVLAPAFAGDVALRACFDRFATGGSPCTTIRLAVTSETTMTRVAVVSPSGTSPTGDQLPAVAISTQQLPTPATGLNAPSLSWPLEVVPATAAVTTRTRTLFPLDSTGGIESFSAASLVGDTPQLARIAPLFRAGGVEIFAAPVNVTPADKQEYQSWSPAVTVVVAGRLRAFRAGVFRERVAAFIAADPRRLVLLRVAPAIMQGARAPAIAVDIAVRPPSPFSRSKQSSAAIRNALEGMRDQNAPCGAPPPPLPLLRTTGVCDIIHLQQTVEAARHCENHRGREFRCDCFVPMATLGSVCRSASGMGAVCTHLSACLAGEIKSMCAGVQPNLFLEVLQVVGITAGIMLLGFVAVHYRSIFLGAGALRTRLMRRSLDTIPENEEVFIPA